MTNMGNDDFYIDFVGTRPRFAALSQFFDKLVAAKKTLPEVPCEPQIIDAAISDPGWIDLLDAEALEKVTSSSEWGLEDVLECVLNGEYHLVGVAFDGGSGRLAYDPWAFPFGGTDALKALVRIFGFEVTRDSLWDGFAESRVKNQ